MKSKKILSFILSLLIIIGDVGPVLATSDGIIENNIENTSSIIDTSNQKSEVQLKLEESSNELEDGLVESEPKEVSVESDFEIVDGILIKYNGVDTDISIPTGVKEIANNVFQDKNITSVIFNEELEKIGDYAFADNTIEEIDFVDSITSIGEGAFRDNKIKSLDTKNVTTIVKSAFQNNLISDLLFGESLKSIGDYSFAINNIAEINIGNNVTNFGDNVFLSNNRYVKVITENDIVPIKEMVEGQFGHVVNPITIKVKYIDKISREEIIPQKVIGTDFTDEGNIFVINEEVTFYPEKLSGYNTKSPIVFTPDKEGYVLTVEYVPNNIGPTILPGNIGVIAPNTSLNSLENLLLSKAKATDIFGEDVTSTITVDVSNVDTSIEGTYTVTYTAKDELGNITTLKHDVYVGSDINQYPIGGGWVIGDFTYSNNSVTGLSKQGKGKLNSLPNGQRKLVLPGFTNQLDKNGKYYIVTDIGYGAFQELNINQVDFSHMDELQLIRDEAFAGNKLEKLDFSNLKKLKTIGNEAFYNNIIKDLAIENLPELESIGNNAFAQLSLGVYETIRFENLPKLTTIGDIYFSISNLNANSKSLRSVEFINLPLLNKIPSYGFQSNVLSNLKFKGLDSLTAIGDYAFNGGSYSGYNSSPSTTTNKDNKNNVEILDLSGAPNIVTIGDRAFTSLGYRQLNFGDNTKLTTIGNYAFATAKLIDGEARLLTSVDFSQIPNLKVIEDGAFMSQGLTSLDLSKNNQLIQIGSIGTNKNDYSKGAFLNNDLESVVFPEDGILDTIGDGSFYSHDYNGPHNIIRNIDLSKETKLKYIGNSAFSNNDAYTLILPEGGATSLETIGFRAFHRNSMQEVVISNQPNLKSIGEQAFFEYNDGSAHIVSLEMINNPSLDTIGNDAFAGNLLEKVYFEDMPLLTSLGKDIFDRNPGLAEYDNMVVIYYEPQDETVLSSRENYLVNPDLILDSYEWSEDDFTYSRSETTGLYSITGLTQTGATKLIKNDYKIVFPKTDSEGNIVEAIEDDVFANISIKELDFSKATGLKKIGKSSFKREWGFEGYKISKITFGDQSSLEEIGANAFASNEITDIDLENAPSLKNIGDSAFEFNKISKVDLSNSTLLESIGKSAFEGNEIVNLYFGNSPNLKSIGQGAFKSSLQNLSNDLDLTSLTGLETIGNSAFSTSYKVTNANVGTINLSGLSNLKTIGDSAFYKLYADELILDGLSSLETIGASAFIMNNLISLDLSDLSSLKTIGDKAFSGNGRGSNNEEVTQNAIATIIWPENSSLETIGAEAFASNKVRELDLKSQVNLISIGNNAFEKNNLTEVYIKDTIKTLTTPFGSNMSGTDGLVLVKVYTDTGENPNNLPNELIYTNNNLNGHIINPKVITISYEDENGNKLANDVIHYVNNDTNTFSAKKLPGYTLIGEDPVTLTFENGEKEDTHTFIYKVQEIKDYGTIKFDYNHINVGENYVEFGQQMTTEFSFNISSAEDVLKDATMRIYFDPDYIDASSIAVGKGETFTAEVHDGYIDIKLLDANGGTEASTIITWKFNKYNTPNNTWVDLPIELLDSEGNLVKKPNYSEPPKIGGYYNTPYMVKAASNKQDSLNKGAAGGVRNMGKLANTRDENGLMFTYVTEAEPVTFTFYVYQTGNVKVLDRTISEYTITDVLPEYTAYIDGEFVTKRAQFDPLLNPGWELQDDGITLTYTANNNGSNIVENIPELKLSFIGANDLYKINNSAKIELVPQDKPDYENNMVISDGVLIYPGEIKEIVSNGDGMFKSIQDDDKYFYDNEIDKSKDFNWTITFGSNGSDPVGDITLKDTIDPRMAYKSIKLDYKRQLNATFKGFDDLGNIVDEGTFASNLYFPSEEVYSFEVHITDTNIDGFSRFNVVSKLRDITSVSYNKEDPSMNTFSNSAYITFTYYKNNKEKVVNDYDSASTYINPSVVKVSPYKTQTYDSYVSLWDKGSYEIGINWSTIVEDDLYKMKVPIKNFEMIDVMPKNMWLSDDMVQLSKEFSLSENAKYEILENYNGQQGVTAIKFTADVLRTDVNKVATIYTEISPFMNVGYYRNDVYMKFDTNDNVEYGKTTVDFNNNQYMNSGVGLNLNVAKEMISRKFIRTVDKTDQGFIPTSGWSTDGVDTPGDSYFQYMLSIINKTDTDRVNTGIYDVFPAIGDYVIQMNDSGTRNTRNTEFSNKLVSISLEGPTSDQFKIQYTNEKILMQDNQLSDDYFETINWVDEPLSDTTAFRVIPKEGQLGRMPKESVFNVLITMQAPPFTKQLQGKKAFNSFVREDNTTTNQLEANIVWNRMAYPKGDITLTKLSDEKDDKGKNIPLEGVEFTLFNTDGSIERVAYTDANGLLEIKDVQIDNYTLVETKVPEGYTSNNEAILISPTDWYDQYSTKHIFRIGKVFNYAPWNGQVKINKVDVNNNPLKGVEFTLENTTTKEQFVGVTDENGYLEFLYLQKGKYKLKETKTLNGLIPIKDRQFNIDYPNKVIDYTSDEAIVNDEASITLFKLGLRKPIDEDKLISQYSPNDGTILGSYQNPYSFEIWDVNADKLVSSRTMYDSKGISIYLKTNKLYSIKETNISKKDEYILNTREYIFMISPDGRLLDENGREFLFGNNFYFPNEPKPIYGRIEMLKEDTNGDLLEGAQFGIYKQDIATGNYNPLLDENGNHMIATSMEIGSGTTADPKRAAAIFDNLENGNYRVRELKAPQGYIKSTSYWDFNINNGSKGSATEIISDSKIIYKFSQKVTNKKLDVKIIKKEYIEKSITEERANELIASNQFYVKENAGTLFNVYKPLVGGNLKFDLYKITSSGDEKVLSNITTKEEGIVDFKDFLFDEDYNYKLVETSTFDKSYMLNESPLIIDIKSEKAKNSFTGEILGSIENKKITGRFTISKYDLSTKTSLSGIEFTLYDANKNPIKTLITDSSGYAIFSDLKLGTYYVSETKTVLGYRLPVNDMEKVEITLDNINIQKVIYNEKQVLPVTGSSQSTIIVVGFTTMLTIAILLNKKQKGEKNETKQAK